MKTEKKEKSKQSSFKSYCIGISADRTATPESSPLGP